MALNIHWIRNRMPFFNTKTSLLEPLELKQPNDHNILYYNLINKPQTLLKTAAIAIFLMQHMHSLNI